MTERDKKRAGGQIVAGVVVLVLGVALLLDQYGSFEFGNIGRLWPLIVVAVGASRLLSADNRSDRRGGLVVLFLGFWMLVSSLELMGLDWEHSWPMVLMGVGLASVIAGDNRRRVRGAFLVFLGVWMQAIVLNYRGMTWENSWPVMMILAGIYLVATALLPRSAHPARCDCEECC